MNTGSVHHVLDELPQRKLNPIFLNLTPHLILTSKVGIVGVVLEIFGYVQHSTFCVLGKFKKELEFEFRNFRNIFREGKEYENKRE